MRDPRKLKAFVLADAFALEVFETARRLPHEETYSLALELRRGAVAIASNIVEGCARRTKKEYAHFLSAAYGSAREVEYQLSLARRLGYGIAPELEASAGEICEALRALIQSQEPRTPL
jgi:four helix bundle protein